jgi:hypothetical protein
MFVKIISINEIEPAPIVKGAIYNYNCLPEEDLNRDGYFRLEESNHTPDDAIEYFQDGNVIRTRVIKNAKYDYRAKRSAEYPPISDVVDAMLKAMEGDEEELQTRIRNRRAVKLKYPKGRKKKTAKAK